MLGRAAQNTVNTVVNTLRKPFAPFLEQTGTDMVRNRLGRWHNAAFYLPLCAALWEGIPWPSLQRTQGTRRGICWW
jgi:hypothetical protein